MTPARTSSQSVPSGRKPLDHIDRREALRRVGFLIGGAVSAPTVSALLAGCSGRTSSSGPYAFKVLSPDQAELVATLVDLIIPDTDTPGARSAGAHEFIDKMLADWLPDAERDRFLAGLAGVEARATTAHGMDFIALSEAQQVALLTELDTEAYADAENRPASDPPFFRSLKELTLAGYYTSEIGASQELLWMAWPGRYDSDVPVSDVGRAWA